VQLLRIVATAWLACALALSGCGQSGVSVPGGLLATATPRPYFDTGAQLAAYATQRRGALDSLAAANPNDSAVGSMTMARPLGPTELGLMLTGAGVDSNYYVEWFEPGTDVSGGGNVMQMGDQLKNYPGLRITYVKTEATLASLLTLAKDDRVWLVDVGGTENYYYLAKSSGLIP
jgi:hypothetical protein